MLSQSPFQRFTALAERLYPNLPDRRLQRRQARRFIHAARYARQTSAGKRIYGQEE